MRVVRHHERAPSSEPLRTQREILRHLWKVPAVPLVLFLSIGVFLFNHALHNWLPALLASGGMTMAQAGLWAAVPTIVGLAGSLLIPRLATPDRRFRILAMLCIASALASVLLHSQAPVAMTSGLILQGIARSSLMTVLILTLVELPGIGERNVGTASGLFFAAAEVGGMLGPLTLGVLYDLTGGFSAGLYFLTAIALLMFASVRRLERLARPEPG